MSRFVYAIASDVEWKTRWRRPEGATDHRFPCKPGEEGEVFIIGEQMMIQAVLDKIFDLSSPDEMKVLRICAHARPGMVRIGKEMLFDVSVHRFQRIGRAVRPACPHGVSQLPIRRHEDARIRR